MINTPENINIFIAYTKEDLSFVEELEVHLSVLERLGMVDKIWYEGLVEAGADWEKTILDALVNADIILLLVSADFIASDFSYQTEMQKAMKLHEEGKARTVPIIVRPCLWTNAPFAKLKVLPHNGIPVASKKWAHIDEPYVQITEEVEKIIVAIKQEVIGQDEQKKSSAYNRSFEEAAHYFTAAKWPEAMAKFQQALLFADQKSKEEVGLINRKIEQCKNENYFQRNFNRGEKAYKENKYKEAISALAQALVFKPENSDALQLKAAAEVGLTGESSPRKEREGKSDIAKFFQIKLFGFEVFKVVIAMSVFGLLAIPAMRLFNSTPDYIVNVESGSVSYRTAEGKEVLETDYINGRNFSKGIAAVENKDGKWGYINGNNEATIEFKYDAAWPHSKDGLAYVKKGGKCGFINQSGRVAIPLVFMDAASFSEGLAMVKKGEKDFAFLNKEGKEIIRDLEGVITPKFSNGEAVVLRKGRKITINKLGKCIEGCLDPNTLKLNEKQRLKNIQRLKEQSKKLKEAGEYDRSQMKLKELKKMSRKPVEKKEIDNELDLVNRKILERKKTAK